MRSLLKFLGHLAGAGFLLGCVISCSSQREEGSLPSITPAIESVVQIRTFVRAENDVIGLLPLVEDGTGSGVVVHRDGYVLTCQHVVSDTAEVHVEIGADILIARIVAEDVFLDLALLKVDRELPNVASWGDSASLREGQPVFVIGYPFGITRAIRSGVVSSTTFAMESPFLVTDAAINPGDSGGGLFTDTGELVGVPARIFCAQGLRANVGIAYAIPGNTAHWFVNKHLPLRRAFE